MNRDRQTLLRIAQTMTEYGGSFAQALAVAMVRADECNLRRIEAAFPDLMDWYENFEKGPHA